jgi:hypothetical protein
MQQQQMTNEDETPLQHPNKRVRINEQDNQVLNDQDNVKPQENAQAPSAASRAALLEAVASHPTAIKDIAESLLKEYITLKNIQRQQANTLARFDDDTWIPRSAKVEFKLSSSTDIMETEDFKTLVTEATTQAKAYQVKAKSLIKSVLSLAIQATKSKFKELMENALFRFGTMILLEDKAYKAEPPTEKFVWHCLSMGDFPARVFDYTSTRKAELRGAFKTRSDDRVIQELSTKNTKDNPTIMDTTTTQMDSDDDLQPLTQQAVVTNQQQNQHFELSTAEIALFNKLCARFSNLITALFATSWDKQTIAQGKLDSDRRLKKQAKEFLKGEKSKKVAIDLETEPKAEPKRITELIQQEIGKAHNKLNKKVDRVVQQVNRSAKNSPRGANQRQQPRPVQQRQPSPTSASSKKKKEGKHQPTGQKEKGNAKKTANKKPGNPRGRSPASKGKGLQKETPKKKTTGGPNKPRGRSTSTNRRRQQS